MSLTISDFPHGAGVSPRGVNYRVWAPDHIEIKVRIESSPEPRLIAAKRGPDGFHTAFDAEGKRGDMYRYLLDNDAVVDPASRFQPFGIEGPSMVVDYHQYPWKCTEWKRPCLRGRVIYELHLGAFTEAGTYRAAIERLGYLADLGVNAIELLPVGAFAGSRNWGYDGVLPFSPANCYGTPDDLRALIDAAHGLGLAVIIDVVYNHVGAVGNVLPKYAEQYFHQGRKNIWGATINFDERAEPVRQFVLQNVAMWLDEYRVDGLRLDAVHAIEDRSSKHIASEIAALAASRGAFTIAEDERNDARIITPEEEGGWGVTGMWADDFHHVTRVSLTHQQEAHFGSFKGTMEELARTLEDGWLYSGQYSPHLKKARGTPCRSRSPEQFVVCISNHDQVGNRPLGDRLHHSIGLDAYRALSVLLCLSPYTPLLFMGQEWATSSPFVFFTDLPGDVGESMASNRRKEFEHYEANYSAETLRRMPDPQLLSSFHLSKLNWDELQQEPFWGIHTLYRTCLQLRARESIFQSPPRDEWTVNPLDDSAISLRWKRQNEEWVLLVGWQTTEMAWDHEKRLPAVSNETWGLILDSNEQEKSAQVPGIPRPWSLREGKLKFPGAYLLKAIPS